MAVMSTHGGGQTDSFAYRRPVLYAAKIAVVCTAIMVVAKSVRVWLGDDSVAVSGVVRYVVVVFTLFFVTAAGFLVVAKRTGNLKR